MTSRVCGGLPGKPGGPITAAVDVVVAWIRDDSGVSRTRIEGGGIPTSVQGERTRGRDIIACSGITCGR